MLKPSKDDPNYEAEMKRWKNDPQAFGQSHIGVSRPTDWQPGVLNGSAKQNQEEQTIDAEEELDEAQPEEKEVSKKPKKGK